MIPISGLGAALALQVIDRTKPQQIEAIRDQPEHARAIEKFRASVGEVQTAEDFVSDFDTYNLVMKAHGLEDRMFGKAMVRKILESDITDRDSLVRRMTNEKFEDLHRAMGFRENGTTTENTTSVAWQDRMVAKYLEAAFTESMAEQDPIVGNVLEFRQRAGEVTNWYDILADKEFAEVMRTALGIPQETAQLDIDRQVDLFRQKMDLEDFRDPDFVADIERTYTALAEAQAPVSGVSSPILQLFQPSNTGFVDITLDIASLSAVGGRSAYL